VTDEIYTYGWGNNTRRAELKGRECVVLARGTMNSILLRFLDTGEQIVTSRNAVRRSSPAA
jgi:hypothetical protein